MARVIVLLALFCACEAAPEPPAMRTLRVRVVDGAGKPVTRDGVVVWWARDLNTKYGTPVRAVEGQVVIEATGPVVLVALPPERAHRHSWQVTRDDWRRVTTGDLQALGYSLAARTDHC